MKTHACPYGGAGLVEKNLAHVFPLRSISCSGEMFGAAVAGSVAT
jgi:hypothetical protein